MLTSVLFAAALAAAPTPRTLRVDWFHTGDATEERFSVDRIVLEPLPFPGRPDRAIDETNLGKYLFEVRDVATNRVLYSRGFSSIYGEWETTAEAREVHRTFSESFRFPAPAGRAQVILKKRDAKNLFEEVWSFEVDPKDRFVSDAPPPPAGPVLAIQRSGAPEDKLDLLLVGDGYTEAERRKFERDARRLVEALFRETPFKERRSGFNVWAIAPPAAKSGISRPLTGVHRRSIATYDAFGSERYILSFENRELRDLASNAPYDALAILVNGETYGGGGIFNLYTTVAAGSKWSEYVFVHELGHSLAALADEYYTSDTAYLPVEGRPEPWEANVTADPKSPKWKDLVSPKTPLPTPWPKAEFEKHAIAFQEQRKKIRAENGPESAMDALFLAQQQHETKLLGGAEHARAVGAFEGANYEASGFFRPQLDCIMFSRDDVPFCRVCSRTLERIFDLYVR